MVDAVGAVANSGTTRKTSGITSIKDLEQNPEFFPIWVAEIQRQNLSTLFSSSSSDNTDSTGLTSYYGGNGSGTSDIFSALGLSSSSSSSLSSLFATQGITSDFSFLTPTASLQSYQVEETLRGLQNYTNLTESKKWLGQLVEYFDPADKLLKTGRVTKIDIENVAKPMFKIDDNTFISLDDIKALSAEVAADTSTAGQKA